MGEIFWGVGERKGLGFEFWEMFVLWSKSLVLERYLIDFLWIFCGRVKDSEVVWFLVFIEGCWEG